MKARVWVIITWDTVHHYQGSIGDPEGSRDLRGEVYVTRRVDQVDEEAVPVHVLLDKRQVAIGKLVVHRDGPEKQMEEKVGNMFTFCYYWA